MRTPCVIFAALMLSSAGLFASPLPAPIAGKFYVGFYYSRNSDNENVSTPEDVKRFENATGANAAWVFFSDNWYESREFPAKMCKWIHGMGKIPYVRLMLRSEPEQDRAEKVFTLNAIAAGKFDADLKAWAMDAKKSGGPLLVEWGTECNGEWFAWNGKWNGNEAGPAKFVAAWRHIVTLMRDAGADNIIWVWHVNDADVPHTAWNKLENYYPGDDYVDWLAVSAYGPQKPTDEDEAERMRDLLDPVYPRLAAISPKKPIILAEFGCTTGNPKVKAADWAKDALADLFSHRWPRICGFCWWNESWQNDDNKAHDTHMVIMDDPGLTNAFSGQLSAEREKLEPSLR